MAPAVQSQMPQQWKSDWTGETERAAIQCVMDHPGNWGDSCYKEGGTFEIACGKEGYSESVCERELQADTMIGIQMQRR